MWNRTTTAKDPLTGKIKQVDRRKVDWVVQERADIRIISDDDWAAAQRRWQEIDGVFPTKRRNKGFEGKQRSYVESHPNHLLSGSLKCGACGGAVGLVSGKGSGYYGCLNASRRACENKVLIARKRLEDKLVAALNEKVLNPELLDQVYERTATKVKELFAHVPEELRLEKIELSRAETRVHHFIEFIASGRRHPDPPRCPEPSRGAGESLSADIQSMEAAKDHAFTPPPRAWIANRIGKLNQPLATRTEKSALALRRLTRAITLSPQKPEVGRLTTWPAANSTPSICWLRTEVRIHCIGGGAGNRKRARTQREHDFAARRHDSARERSFPGSSCNCSARWPVGLGVRACDAIGSACARETRYAQNEMGLVMGRMNHFGSRSRRGTPRRSSTRWWRARSAANVEPAGYLELAARAALAGAVIHCRTKSRPHCRPRWPSANRATRVAGFGEVSRLTSERERSARSWARVGRSGLLRPPARFARSATAACQRSAQWTAPGSARSAPAASPAHERPGDARLADNGYIRLNDRFYLRPG